MSLAVIIINYRTPDYTLGCLASLAAERATLPGLRVWLLDNASGDDSLPRLEAAIAAQGWGEWVTLRPQSRNLGFAGGNNAGFRMLLEEAAPPPFVLLLNSDTVVHPGCLRAALDALQRGPDIGILSCMLRNRDGSVQNICRRFPTPAREAARALGLPSRFPRAFAWAELEDAGWDRETTARDVDWVGGAFMLLRTETVRRLGGMDTTFFFYGEDIAFCQRMHRHGLRVHFDPSGTITHFGGGSSDSTRLPSRRKEILLWKARFQVQRRCYGVLAAGGLRLLFVLAYGANLLLLLLTGRRDSARFRGAWSAWTALIRPLEAPP